MERTDSQEYGETDDKREKGIKFLLCLRQLISSHPDYIVVGSGPGGGIVASNLALAGHSVLLIEAGRDASDDLSTTVNALYYPQSMDLQWSFFARHHSDPEVESRYRLLT